MNLHVRAIPQIINITEEYHYTQYISSNDSFREKGAPTGKIEVIVPYDGYKYFSQQAKQDVKQQLNGNTVYDKDNALIGHLALSNFEKTDLEDLLYKNGVYESLPIKVPIRNNHSTLDWLNSDRHCCVTEYHYKPESLKIQLIKPTIKIWDDDAGFLDLEVSGKSKQHCQAVANKIARQVKSGFGRSSSDLKGTLLILFCVSVDIHKYFILDVELRPKIARISIKSPTITSLDNFQIIKDFSSKKTPQKIFYNSPQQTLELTDITTWSISKGTNVNYESYSCDVGLIIKKPGELYHQYNLEGEIIVEIPTILCSGLKARYYGFDGHELSDNKDLIQLKTIINIDFNIALNEAFAKRKRTTAHQLIFNNILPTEDNLNIIKDNLQSQGFKQEEFLKTETRDNNQASANTTITKTRLGLFAKYSEGIDMMDLWIIVDGEKIETVIEYTRNNRKYTRVEETGKLTMYILGQFPRSSKSLTNKINTLHQELRDRLKGSEVNLE